MLIIVVTSCFCLFTLHLLSINNYHHVNTVFLVCIFQTLAASQSNIIMFRHNINNKFLRIVMVSRVDEWRLRLNSQHWRTAPYPGKYRPPSTGGLTRPRPNCETSDSLLLALDISAGLIKALGKLSGARVKSQHQSYFVTKSCQKQWLSSSDSISYFGCGY